MEDSPRFQQLLDWLATCPSLQQTTYTAPQPASNDASFRRYYRIKVTDQEGRETTRIIMDAPPEHEDCEPFVRIAAQMLAMQLNVPQVLEQDLAQGFLLLSDLGNETYLSQLNDDNVDQLYGDALSALTTLQAKGQQEAATLPLYDASLLKTEMNLFTDWLLKEHLAVGLTGLEHQAWLSIQDTLAKSALAQPQVYVHRDYHSRNLMVTPQQNPGILDFQDAVKGALTYDAVSMLRDCYVSWPLERVQEWQREYFLMLTQANIVTKNEWKGFVQAMDWMGIQRHLKASGIFARLSHRDGKSGYLNDIPLTLSYIQQVGEQYSEMHDLVRLLENRVLPTLEKQAS